MSFQNIGLVAEGDYSIVKNGAMLRLVELKKNKPHFLAKRKVNLSAAIGQTYGSFFEIKSDGALVKLDNPEEVNDLLVKVTDDSEMKDNRSLTDTGESQKLTTTDIEAMKKQGVSGQELVKILVENSSSFQDKTSFAKEKYLRKKQQKYLNFVQLLKPNIRLLADMYYFQGPQKVCNLRIDTLSQMLAFCNIMSGGKFMIVETVMGLLTAAVLERLGTCGYAIQLHLGPFSIHPSQQAIKALNIPPHHLQSIFYNIDLQSVMDLLQNSPDKDANAMIVDSVLNDTVQNSTPVKEGKAEKRDHIQKAKEILSTKRMDSLLIAVKYHPVNLLPLINFLSYSRPFAIFSTFQEPLVDCYVKLKTRGDIIALNITDTWLRKYQVLPDRTHPFHNMSGTGGFLLTGIRVELKP